MKTWLAAMAIVFLAGVRSLASADAILFDRIYSKVDSSTGEHCSGWSVELWRSAGAFFGQIEHHRGLCGDPPMGLLEDIHHDPRDGRFSFKSKISDGVDARGKPSCDRLMFRGTLGGARLAGELQWMTEGAPAVIERIDLPGIDAEPFGPRRYPSAEEWHKTRAELLKVRGPRC